MKEPIDLVIPMVFPQDPDWQQEYIRYKGGTADSATKHVRYRSWGTEELLVRCIMRYMPWVHCIYILLSGGSQVQLWMKRLLENSEAHVPQVRLVFHHDFMPSKYLPCFSSPCIEMFLHRIPGLASRFVYANDDMFPLSALREEDFFLDGRPCQVFAEKRFPVKPNIFQRKCIYQYNMVVAPFGIRNKKTWLKNGHSLAPILKSSCEEVWRRHGDEILRYISPLKRTDRSYNHYVYSLYQHFAGLDTAHAPREQYVGTGIPDSCIASIIRDPAAGVVCFNDNERIGGWEQRAALVRKEIWGKIKE